MPIVALHSGATTPVRAGQPLFVGKRLDPHTVTDHAHETLAIDAAVSARARLLERGLLFARSTR